jgi:hypothetical protein
LTDEKTSRVCIYGTFAVDGLEPPLRCWLDKLLGIGSKIQLSWAPYSDALQSLPDLLRGPEDREGFELVALLIRLEDLCVCHPESRYAPETRKAAKDGDDAEMRKRRRRERRERYGCAPLEAPDDQLMEATTALNRIISDALKS